MKQERYNELLIEQYRKGRERYYWCKLPLIPSIISNGVLIEYYVTVPIGVASAGGQQTLEGSGNTFEEAVADVRKRWIARVDSAFERGFLVFNDRA